MRRIQGGYKFSRRRKERRQNPILVVACEGATEKRYLMYASSGHRLRIQAKSFEGHHGTQLVDDAIKYTESVRIKNPDSEIEIITGVVYDLESLSKKSIAAAIEAVEYARTNRVKIWVNIPLIERWYLMHYQHFSVQRSGNVAIRTLKALSSHNQIPKYKKPGSPRFYTDLKPRTSIAIDHCKSSHIDEIENDNIPCFCNIHTFIRSFDTT